MKNKGWQGFAQKGVCPKDDKEEPVVQSQVLYGPITPRTMNRVDQVMPGKDVKRILVYFEDCKRYTTSSTANDGANAVNNLYQLVTEEGVIESRPSHWIALK